MNIRLYRELLKKLSNMSDMQRNVNSGYFWFHLICILTIALCGRLMRIYFLGGSYIVSNGPRRTVSDMFH